MLKKDLLRKLADKNGLPLKKIDAVLNDIAAIAQEEIQAGREFIIPDVAKIATKATPERQARNPASGEPVTIPEHTKITIKPLAFFKTKL